MLPRDLHGLEGSALTVAVPTLPEFAARVGYPVTDWQARSLRLDKRTTVIRASRQVGKSYSLAVLAAWWAFTRPGQTVLVVSAGDDSAKRLLASIRRVAAHPLLRGSTVDESQSLLTLTNGSTVRSAPQSERAIRGWTVDLLLIDEASMVSDDVLLGAAYPTTAARPDACIVLASSLWAMQGAFYRFWLLGDTPEQAVHHWHYTQAPWITPAVIDHARATLPPLRFRAEYDAEFVGREDAYFDPDSLLAAVAPYRMLPPDEATGEVVVVGLDHGRAYDRHAIVALGVLDDYGRNDAPVLYIPFAETSQRSYPDQMQVIVGMARPRNALPRLLPRFYDDDAVIRNGPLTIYRDVRQLPMTGQYRPTACRPWRRHPATAWCASSAR